MFIFSIVVLLLPLGCCSPCHMILRNVPVLGLLLSFVWPIGRMLALHAVGRDIESYQRFEKLYMLFSCLAFSTLGKSMGVKLGATR